MAFIDELLSVETKRERVELPDGRELYMRPLSGVEAERLVDKKGLANVVGVVITTATDKQGHPLFKAEDEEKLKQLPYPVLQKLLQVSNKLNDPEDSSKN